MKQLTILLISLFGFAGIASGQGGFELDFPRFPGQTVKLYYFLGNKTDSLSVVLDASGRGKADPFFPGAETRGVAHLVVPGVGAVECIVGEPSLRIVCEEEHVNKETVSFPGSAENAFLYESFGRKSRLLERQGWLQAGGKFYAESSTLLDAMEKELEVTKDSLVALDREIAASPLYAARFIEWADFMNRLYEAEQSRDPGKAAVISEEMENRAPIEALYTSGRLWGSVHNFYISMFNRLNTPGKQEEYAASIIRTAARLKGGVQERFFAGAIFETERFGWTKAQEVIVRDIAASYPDMPLEDGSLQRLVGLLRTGNGDVAPALAGMSARFSSPTLLVFYESGCGNCDIQLKEIKNRYAELQEKGIRVVTVSADRDTTVYEYHSKDFPWEDKLCDYEGFEGADFKNYGVIGTPTIFLIDETGAIEGRYARLEDCPLGGVKN